MASHPEPALIPFPPVESPARDGVAPPVEVMAPSAPPVPFVFASPHSGRIYPPAFLARARLAGAILRRSEDSYVDWLFRSAPACGASLVHARFPRVFVDANRSPRELDPLLFDVPLDPETVEDTPSVRAGLGVVPRVVAPGVVIHEGSMTLAEAQDRIARHHTPYHAALRGAVESVRSAFGRCFLIDCHSMPSMIADAEAPLPDVVLGDRFGESCAPGLIDALERLLRAEGLSVRRNMPYAGAYTTRHYGRPEDGVHAVQVEINRGLYLDEERHLPSRGLQTLTRHMESVVARLTALSPESLVKR